MMALLSLVWKRERVNGAGLLVPAVAGVWSVGQCHLLLMLMIREGEVARVASYFYLVPP